MGLARWIRKRRALSLSIWWGSASDADNGGCEIPCVCLCVCLLCACVEMQSLFTYRLLLHPPPAAPLPSRAAPDHHQSRQSFVEMQNVPVTSDVVGGMDIDVVGTPDKGSRASRQQQQLGRRTTLDI